MRILADKDIPYISRLFNSVNEVKTCDDGRMISSDDLRDIDVLIIRSTTMVNSVLLCGNLLKFIGTATSGIDHIDQGYLETNNIKFASAAGSNAIAVVEYVLAALFWLAQRDHFFLRDKTVGIVGTGHIGSLLNLRLRSFGVNTLLCDPYLSKVVVNTTWKSLEVLISESDILTFHTPLTYTGKYPTWHMVDINVLDALPTCSTLINTTRGGIVDNAALLRVLRYGKKINTILDVWEMEPNLSLSLLSYVDIGTAHIAGYTAESKIRSIMTIYSAYCNYFNVLNNIKLDVLFPTIIDFIKIKELDEFLLNQLIRSVYDIYHDHVALQFYAKKTGGFDYLRRCCINRREWSSISVKTNKDYKDEILSDFGFS